MKILVTVGFEKRSFDRLLQAVDECVEMKILPKELKIQTGHSKYIPKYGEYKRFRSPDDMKKAIERSDIIITHGGVGTVLTCFTFEKIPIIFPRMRRFGEHVDDHQVEFARVMEKHYRAISVYSKEALFQALKDFESLKKLCVTDPIFNGKISLRNHLKRSLTEMSIKLMETE